MAPKRALRASAARRKRIKAKATRGFAWEGEPARVVAATGRTHYDGFDVDGEVFRRGDSVSVLVDEHVGPTGYHAAALITDLWQDRDEQMLMELRWYYAPRETRLANRNSKEYLPRELFETDQSGVHSVACVDFRIRVYASEEAMEADTESTEPKFFCRWFYSDRTRALRPRLRGAGAGADDDDDEEEEEEAAQAGAGAGAAAQDDDPLARASTQLQLAAVPRALPCREAERAKVFTFLEGAVQRGGLGCALYISGMPGTGKTATVMEVVRSLQERADLPPFQFVEVNGMKLARPDHIYSTLWEALTGQRVSAKLAAQHLDQRFSTHDPRRQCLVVLADELDALVTSKQMVLYNLFDWPTRAHANLVVVGIANTMDLPERLLPRVSSRIGMGRVVFSAYTKDQIKEIVTARLSELSAFGPGAVEIAARKVAAVSGDVRRALQLCRLAVKICRERVARAGGGGGGGGAGSTACVTIADVMEAAKNNDEKQNAMAIARAPLVHRAVLSAVLLHGHRSDTEVTDLETVENYVGQWGLDFVDRPRLLEVVRQLGGERVLLVSEPRGAAAGLLLQLGVQADDVLHALTSPQLRPAGAVLSPEEDRLVKAVERAMPSHML